MAALTNSNVVTVVTMMTVMVMMMMTTTITTVEGFPFGAPNFVCRSMRPTHPGREQVYRPDTFPYNIHFSSDRAMPGSVVIVTVSVKDPSRRFLGLLSTAIAPDSSYTSGYISTPTDNFKLLNCTSSGKTAVGSGITHNKRLNTTTASFMWRVPNDAVIGSQYNIRLTIVQEAAIYWVGLNNTLTVGQPARTSRPLTTSTNAESTSWNTEWNTGSASSKTGSASSNTGSASSNTGSTSAVPGRSGSVSDSNKAEARPSDTTQSEPQHPSESNLVDGHRNSLPTTNGRGNGRGRVEGRGRQRGGENAGRMTAWLSGWFGR